jgi:hypothetical protein
MEGDREDDSGSYQRIDSGISRVKLTAAALIKNPVSN